MHVALTVSQVFEVKWEWPYSMQGQTAAFKFAGDILVPEHTYYLIFSEGQEKALEIFLGRSEINILFKDIAVNRNSGYGRLPRNTFVVFELKDAE